MIIDIVQHVHTSPFALIHLKAKSTNQWNSNCNFFPSIV